MTVGGYLLHLIDVISSQSLMMNECMQRLQYPVGNGSICFSFIFLPTQNLEVNTVPVVETIHLYHNYSNFVNIRHHPKTGNLLKKVLKNCSDGPGTAPAYWSGQFVSAALVIILISIHCDRIFLHRFLNRTLIC
jgi:hypothetical protein